MRHSNHVCFLFLETEFDMELVERSYQKLDESDPTFVGTYQVIMIPVNCKRLRCFTSTKILIKNYLIPFILSISVRMHALLCPLQDCQGHKVINTLLLGTGNNVELKIKSTYLTKPYYPLTQLCLPILSRHYCTIYDFVDLNNFSLLLGFEIKLFEV